MEKRYFGDIDVCKGFAIMVVLLHHSFILTPINLSQVPWGVWVRLVDATFFMQVFFLLSGYLYAFSKPRSFKENLINKAKRLLLPFLSYEAISMTVKMLIPNIANRQVDSVGAFIKNGILYGGELWFVYVLFFLFIIWPELLKLINKRQIVIVLIVMTLLYPLVPDDTDRIFMWPRVYYYSIFFLGGYLLKEINLEPLKDRRSLFVSSLFFIFVNCLLVGRIEIVYVNPFLFNVIGCFFCWTLSIYVVNNNYFQKVSELLSFAGRYSLSYYWLNGFGLVAARIIACRLVGGGSFALVSTIFILCVIFETIAVLICRRIPVVKQFVGIK